MRKWNLASSDPAHLIIAADARLTDPDYLSDHIWELKFREGEPPAMLIESSLGLRVRSLSLFPRFQKDHVWLSDPELFHKKPALLNFAPNYLKLTCMPYATLEVELEYWVQSSNILTGRIKFTNMSLLEEKIGFEWAARLVPVDKAKMFSASVKGIHTVLTAGTEELFPVCFMTGGPTAGSSPNASLEYDLELGKEASRSLTWVLAITDDETKSYELARSMAGNNQDAQVAHIDLLQQSQHVEISTGNTDLDAGLAFSQKAAQSLLMRFNGIEGAVLHRRPEDGASNRPDGRDYNHSWAGVSALDLLYLLRTIGAGSALQLARILTSFLDLQQPDGFIPWRTSLNGTEANRSAQPLLAEIAWKIYQHTEDSQWLESIYPKLIAFSRHWFGQKNDRDLDAYPEWQHAFQSGFDDSNLTHPWNDASVGASPEFVEAPSLAAMLINELRTLRTIGDELHLSDEEDSWLAEQEEKLQANLASVWDEDQKTWHYRDASTHGSHSGRKLLNFSTPGKTEISLTFDTQTRLILKFTAASEFTRTVRVKLTGENNGKPVTEEISPRQINWLYGSGRCSSESVYTRINSIEISGLPPGDLCELYSIDYSTEDLSLLLPAWSADPSSNLVGDVIEHNLLPRYNRSFGLSPFPRGSSPATAELINLPYNLLMIEAAQKAGLTSQAVALFLNLTSAVINSLRTNHEFLASIDAVTGKALSDTSNCLGFIPVQTFLRLAGIELLSRNKVILNSLNQFPFKINVQFKGIRIRCDREMTTIHFPGGVQFNYTGGESKTYRSLN